MLYLNCQRIKHIFILLGHVLRLPSNPEKMCDCDVQNVNVNTPQRVIVFNGLMLFTLPKLF